MQSPVFIVGFPRSGTTLLQLLICYHKEFFTVPETHYFSYVLEGIQGWEKKILSEKDIEIVISRLGEKPGIILHYDFFEDIEKFFKGMTVGELLERIIIYIGKLHFKEGTRWVEKTPRHALFIPQIISFFPDCKILNILREPKDTLSSPIGVRNFNSKEAKFEFYLKKAEEWVLYVSTALEFERRYNNMKSIKYEELILNPNKTMKTISDFLKFELDPNCFHEFAINYKKSIVSWEDRHKGLCKTNRIIDRRGIWKKRLTEEDTGIIESKCGKLMQELGY